MAASESNSYWFAPSPSEWSASRLNLDFGLRSSDLFFRELVVPEISRIWFVRQLSWPVGAIALHSDLKLQGGPTPKPTAISHGIEALACKLEFATGNGSPRVLGTRAFGRDSENIEWSFKELSTRRHYVQNTHRQATTRALRQDGGLGFAHGVRFDFLELDKIGQQLADAFLNRKAGKTNLRNWLIGWIRGDLEVPARPQQLYESLSPELPTETEQAIVKARLLDVSSASSTTRRRLAEAIKRPATMPDINETILPRLAEAGHGDQARSIRAALAFGAVLDRTREVLSGITAVLESASGGVAVKSVAADRQVRTAIKALKTAANHFQAAAAAAGVKDPPSAKYADSLDTAKDDAEIVRLIVLRATQVVGLADGMVIRAGMFRRIDPIDSSPEEDGDVSHEPDRTNRTFRIANFHSLLRDVERRGAA